MTIYGTSDVFDVRPAAPAKARAKTGTFFSDFSELKQGDYVVHVDDGIGQSMDCASSKAKGRRANSFAGLRG